jgi:hypothetical protein
MIRDIGSGHWDPLVVAIPYLNNIAQMYEYIELMMDIFELLLQNDQRHRVRSLGSLGCGDPLPKQHCSDVRVFKDL